MSDRADRAHDVDTGDERTVGDSRRGRRTRRPVLEERGRRPGGERRVPAWVVIPLAVAAGYAVSSIAGGIFGLLVGLVLWWSRR